MTITKEYRITLPISLEEYRVAQLYSVAESSKVTINLCNVFSAFFRTRPAEVKASKSSKMIRIQLKTQTCQRIRKAALASSLTSFSTSSPVCQLL